MMQTIKLPYNLYDTIYICHYVPKLICKCCKNVRQAGYCKVVKTQVSGYEIIKHEDYQYLSVITDSYSSYGLENIFKTRKEAKQLVDQYNKLYTDRNQDGEDDFLKADPKIPFVSSGPLEVPLDAVVGETVWYDNSKRENGQYQTKVGIGELIKIRIYLSWLSAGIVTFYSIGHKIDKSPFFKEDICTYVVCKSENEAKEFSNYFKESADKLEQQGQYINNQLYEQISREFKLFYNNPELKDIIYG